MMTFEEAMGIFRSGNTQLMIDKQDEVLEFLSEIESTGGELLSAKGNEYILEFLTTVQAASLMALRLSNPEKSSIYSLLMANEDVDAYITMSIKFALGLAAMEELH